VPAASNARAGRGEIDPKDRRIATPYATTPASKSVAVSVAPVPMPCDAMRKPVAAATAMETTAPQTEAHARSRTRQHSTATTSLRMSTNPTAPSTASAPLAAVISTRG
jgi:hypothetical protein